MLCETVKTFVEKVAKAHENDPEKESKNIAEKVSFRFSWDAVYFFFFSFFF